MKLRRGFRSDFVSEGYRSHTPRWDNEGILLMIEILQGHAGLISSTVWLHMAPLSWFVPVLKEGYGAPMVDFSVQKFLPSLTRSLRVYSTDIIES